MGVCLNLGKKILNFWGPRLPLVAPPLNSPLCRGRLFLVGYCVQIHRFDAAKSHDVFYIIYFFIVPFAAPNDWTVYPPALSSGPASAISSPLTLPPTVG
jgi:hypothetical protein